MQNELPEQVRIYQALEAERVALKEAEVQLSSLEKKFEQEQTFVEFFTAGETKDIVEVIFENMLFFYNFSNSKFAWLRALSGYPWPQIAHSGLGCIV
eukprot:COSAG02_NODE_8611_length_2506_cov_144.744080_2_plen_97_part_00